LNLRVKRAEKGKKSEKRGKEGLQSYPGRRTTREEEERRKKMMKKKLHSRERERLLPGCPRRRAQIEVDGAKNGQQSKQGFANLGEELVCEHDEVSRPLFCFNFLFFPKRSLNSSRHTLPSPCTSD